MADFFLDLLELLLDLLEFEDLDDLWELEVDFVEFVDFVWLVVAFDAPISSSGAAIMAIDLSIRRFKRKTQHLGGNL